MNKIYMPNESKRPVIICPHCKTKQIIDIRGFNKDITQIAKYTCNDCRGTIYGSLLLLANSNLNSLMQNVQAVVKAVNAKNYLEVGEKGKVN